MCEHLWSSGCTAFRYGNTYTGYSYLSWNSIKIVVPKCSICGMTYRSHAEVYGVDMYELHLNQIVSSYCSRFGISDYNTKQMLFDELVGWLMNIKERFGSRGIACEGAGG